ncbi:hypothetical protein EJ110_NYTH54977 [Nymphaea thermarum]|nr:hypothetical protein EJ110_NYTH54977 [Nymphaea thermarum]
MRVEGQLRGRKVSILVDTGSTYNFICEKSTRALGCRIENQPAFDVLVGDGGTLKCRGRCTQKVLEIQGHKFPVEFFTLAMAGAGLVLGVQWLRNLGEVVWDFVGMRIHFGQTKKECPTLEAVPRKPMSEQKTFCSLAFESKMKSSFVNIP